MAESVFDPQKVGLAVITSYPKWYRGKLRSIKHSDKVRGDLALEFAHKATQLGYRLVIADGKSAKSFVKELALTPNLILSKRKKLGSGFGKRLAIDKISKIPGVEVIVLTEAEKVSLLTDCMQVMVEPILQGKADIVVSSRSDALFKSTYPRYMYASEVEGNTIYNEALRSNNILSQAYPSFDWFFGPRVLRNDKNIISLFKRIYRFSGVSILEKLYSPDKYSNVQFFPIVSALKKKMNVVSVEVPFSYPRLQKENEEIGARDVFIEKRSMQRVSILIDLMHFLSYLEKKRSSRVKAVK